MAKSSQTFATALFKVWAEITPAAGGAAMKIGDETNGGDIVSISATFALNTIPTATLVLATGYNAATLKPATIHTIKDQLRPRDKVTVYVRVIAGAAGDAAKVKPGKYKIFDGYLAGIGYQRSHNHANYVLHLIHWLDDLNNSTAVCGDWLPGAPADYARAALVTAAGRTSALGPAPSISRDLASARNLREDLWEKTIKPICYEVAGFAGDLSQKIVRAKTHNEAARKALDRMPGNGGPDGKVNYYKPLKFRAPNSGAFNIDNSLANYFRAVFADSTSQNSFWAKIITSMAAEFMFAISPAVDWALPIPFCAGVRWKPGAPVIEASDYSYANFTTNMAQMIEAVHIVYTVGSYANVKFENGQRTQDPPNSYFYPYASWPKIAESAATPYDGLKLFKTPPGWLSHAAAAGLSAWSSVQGAGQTATPAAASNKRAAKVTPTPAAYKAATNITSDFAKHWYLTEVLQQRVGELSGPVRFDIAPGSIVKIIAPDSDRITATANEHVIASVISVSYVINSERATAGTSFTIAHTKTPAEADTKSNYSTGKPPLYGADDDTDDTVTFYSAPLAEQQP
jgi:hypothetical protein